MPDEMSALQLVFSGDAALYSIVALSLYVSVCAVVLAARVATLVWDARFSLVTTLLAGFGRAAAEVGTVMVVGGNIDGFTRTMTTAIALEPSKGDLPLAMGLGMVLITLIIVVNALAWGARRLGEVRAG